MVHRCFVLLTVAWLAMSESVYGQRVIVVPEHGSGDEIVIIADLPADTLALLRQELHAEPKVAFLYLALLHLERRL